MKKNRSQKPRKSPEEILSSPLLSIEDAAIVMRVDKRTIYNLIKIGKLPTMQISQRVQVIRLEDFLSMMNNSYKPVRTKTQPEEINAQVEEINNKKHARKQRSSNPPRTYGTHPSSYKPKTTADDYQQSIKSSVIDEKDFNEPFYTMADVLRKFKYSYGRFYALRIKYDIPTIKMYSTKCFPQDKVDEAMKLEDEEQGRNRGERWLTCFEIMSQYGLGKTQVRRFAETHGVRIRKTKGGRANLYMKSDWEEARRQAALKKTNQGGSLKQKREK